MRWLAAERVPVTTYREELHERQLAVHESHASGGETWRLADVRDLKKAIESLSGDELAQVACPHERRLFVDIDGAEVDFSDWEFASRTEVEAFALERRIAEYADCVETSGAPAFAASVRGLPRLQRDFALCACADLLRERGKDGRASQVLAFRWDEDATSEERARLAGGASDEA